MSGGTDGGVDAIWCGELELSAATMKTDSLARSSAQVVRVLVRLHGEPLGYVSLPVSAERTALRERCEQRARDDFGPAIVAHLLAEGISWSGGDIPAAASTCPMRSTAEELVSIVIATRDRADHLSHCLESLADLDYPNLEFLVVDNGPSDDRTRDLVQRRAAADPRLRYLHAETAGVSRARNLGLTQARGTYVAFTDDDVRVDRGWAAGIVRGFGGSAMVGAVTGLVATASLDSAPERFFDARTPWWSTRCTPDLFCRSEPDGRGPLFPFSPGIFGTGANMAVRRDLFIAIGGFDPALGPGTKPRGGEDLDVFLRILQSGWCLAYEPSALVWHHHRADWAALTSQMFGYGSGLTACFAKVLCTPGVRRDFLRRLPGMLGHAGSRGERPDLRSDVPVPPRAVRWQERRGLLLGPWLYARARREQRAV